MSACSRLLSHFMRKKVFEEGAVERSALNRVLSIWDLTLLAVGSTLGVGIYVLAGQVARQDAGPSVVLSFVIAAIASIFAGLCYAEFGARVPRAGSAYVYSYVSVGELVAFVIGWNLILEYAIGGASVAKGYSGYVDSMTSSAMSDAFLSFAAIDIPFLGSYFDFFALGLTLLVTALLAFGARESAMFNSIFTVLNLFVVAFVIIAGCMNANVDNWEVDPSHLSINNTDEDPGSGGFMPFGMSGMVSGAATCFFGFVGFDVIASTGEEAHNPQRSIPLSMGLSLLIIFISYVGIAVAVTLMWPYYDLDLNAPIPIAFGNVGWVWAQWIVTIGALFGLSTSLLGAIYPLPRVLYAMGSDGLVFRIFGHVHPKSQTPLLATVVGGVLTAIIAAMFDLDQLVDMMSIGTLLAYTLVAASVLVLRFEQDSEDEDTSMRESTNLVTLQTDPTVSDVLKQMCNINWIRKPTALSQSVSAWAVLIYCVFVTGFDACGAYAMDALENGESWAITITSVLFVLVLGTAFVIAVQPRSSKRLFFMVPFVPFIPCLSILVNIYLMLKLSVDTWIRFAVWMIIGALIYFLYAIPTSGRQTDANNGNPNTPNGNYALNNAVENAKADLMNGNFKGEKEISPMQGKSEKTSGVDELLNELDTSMRACLSTKPITDDVRLIDEIETIATSDILTDNSDAAVINVHVHSDDRPTEQDLDMHPNSQRKHSSVEEQLTESKEDVSGSQEGIYNACRPADDICTKSANETTSENTELDSSEEVEIKSIHQDGLDLIATEENVGAASEENLDDKFEMKQEEALLLGTSSSLQSSMKSADDKDNSAQERNENISFNTEEEQQTSQEEPDNIEEDHVPNDGHIHDEIQVPPTLEIEEEIHDEIHVPTLEIEEEIQDEIQVPSQEMKDEMHVTDVEEKSKEGTSNFSELRSRLARNMLMDEIKRRNEHRENKRPNAVDDNNNSAVFVEEQSENDAHYVPVPPPSPPLTPAAIPVPPSTPSAKRQHTQNLPSIHNVEVLSVQLIHELKSYLAKQGKDNYNTEEEEDNEVIAEGVDAVQQERINPRPTLPSTGLYEQQQAANFKFEAVLRELKSVADDGLRKAHPNVEHPRELQNHPAVPVPAARKPRAIAAVAPMPRKKLPSNEQKPREKEEFVIDTKSIPSYYPRKNEVKVSVGKPVVSSTLHGLVTKFEVMT